MASDASEQPTGVSYRLAGVDIDAAESAKSGIARRVAATHGPSVLRGIGHFGGFFRAPHSDGSVVLVSSADSVGTKVLLASLVDRHRGIGIDLVNHCVNDILACGARPLFFLDYFATPELDPKALAEIVDGMAEACEAAGCALIGGETAQLPGVYQEGTYDLAGFIVGAVEEDRIIDGSRVRPGDALMGLPSSGLHTNGFSLARVALDLVGEPEQIRERLEETPGWSGQTLGDLLLEPHRSYLTPVTRLFDQDLIHGMAHITGGGLEGNISRVIPEGLQAVIDAQEWTVPALFRAIERAGNIDPAEMYRVFNMGIGFVIIVDATHVDRVTAAVNGARVIGSIEIGRDERRARLTGLPTAGWEQ